jgi:hypothetical protein
MKNLTVIIFIILTSLSACKDDCLTCPDNEAVINGQCECIGIPFNGDCLNSQLAFKTQYLRGDDNNTYTPYFSNPTSCDVNFDFDNQPLFIYLTEITEEDGYAYALIALETAARPTNTNFKKVYFSGMVSDRVSVNFDSLNFNKDYVKEYKGFVYVGEEALGFDPSPEFYSTNIDGEVCYLRPYLKILDKDYIRVTFRYVTATEEVKAECVRLFHK